MILKIVNNFNVHLIASDGTIFSLGIGPIHYASNYLKDISYDGVHPQHNLGNFRNPTGEIESEDCEMAVMSHDDFITQHFFNHIDDDVVPNVPIKTAIQIAMNYEERLKQI